MVVPIEPSIVVSIFFSVPSFPAKQRPDKGMMLRILQAPACCNAKAEQSRVPPLPFRPAKLELGVRF